MSSLLRLYEKAAIGHNQGLSAWDGIYLPAPITPKDAFVNDFTLDASHNHAFISDPAGGANAALIVVNLSTGVARRVLEGHHIEVDETFMFLMSTFLHFARCFAVNKLLGM